MQANRKRHWPYQRMPLQRAIMALSLSVYPQWMTIPELSREIGSAAGMRRFTRLTNGFSRKVENLAHAVSLHFMHYNFARPMRQ